MSRKQLVIEQAKRILGSYDAAAEAVSTSPFVPRDNLESGLELLERPVEGNTPVGRAMAEEAEREVTDGLDGMKKLELGQDDRITPREQAGLEAIILLAGRPAILIQEGDFMEPPKLWADLKNVREQIKDAIRRVGRIEVSNNPNFEWLGTGFLAGTDVIITNRHVALEFSKRMNDGNWTFRAPMSASVNLRAELGSEFGTGVQGDQHHRYPRGPRHGDAQGGAGVRYR